MVAAMSCGDVQVDLEVGRLFLINYR